MSTLGTALTTWKDFIQLPDEEWDNENGTHLELQDGEVVVVAPPRAVHQWKQGWLAHWFSDAAAKKGYAATEVYYRPAANLQFWRADVAYLPNDDWALMRGNDYPVYSPPLIVEVLSPSNRAVKIQRQRIAAFSGGTREFWVVDLVARTIEVTVPGRLSQVYGEDEIIPVTVITGAMFPVRELFQA
jgi:Uma2 family endonuclease